MTSKSGADPSHLEGQEINKAEDCRAAWVFLGALLMVQLYLVYFKSFNWDEFLHFSQVYTAREGTLFRPSQVLHSRILFWAPDISEHLVTQLRFARLFMWGCTLITLAGIYGLARQFTSPANALYAAIGYLAAGYVFTQSFSIRPDPLVTASLMTALLLLASGRLGFSRAIAAGLLVGLAGMITFKAVVYAPCFAGIAWWRLRKAPHPAKTITYFAATTVAAAVSFSLIYWLHTSGLADIPERYSSASSTARTFGQWFFSDDKFALVYVGRQALWGIVFLACLILAPFAWRQERDSSLIVPLVGLAAPLILLAFYRNTFPYLFVFLLAPVSVSIAASFGVLRKRYGDYATLALLALSPIALTVLEPRDVIARQQAMIEYIHREYPEPVGYLARSGAVADYPRVISHLTTGNGIRGYNRRAEPLIAESIQRGELAFVLSTNDTITAALQGNPLPNTFLPEDVALLSENYVQQWGPLYREGKDVPAGGEVFDFTVPHTGSYTLDGPSLIIDGHSIASGQTVVLEVGPHQASGPREERTTLWRGELPGQPPFDWDGGFYTEF